jgi:diamine N-acetyltransferase
VNTPAHDQVELRDVTRDNLRAVLNLAVHPHQAAFVASNAHSIAEAHFDQRAWFRAIYAADSPVGFVMLAIAPAEGIYYVWRFMIDRHHQGKGYGRRAMELVIEHVRRQPNATRLLLSYLPGAGGPAGFYARLGFVPTGEVDDDGETYAALAL